MHVAYLWTGETDPTIEPTPTNAMHGREGERAGNPTSVHQARPTAPRPRRFAQTHAGRVGSSLRPQALEDSIEPGLRLARNWPGGSVLVGIKHRHRIDERYHRHLWHDLGGGHLVDPESILYRGTEDIGRSTAITRDRAFCLISACATS